jgi:hypothetical protein
MTANQEDAIFRQLPLEKGQAVLMPAFAAGT